MAPLQLVSNDRSDDVVLVSGVVDRDQSALESIYRKYGGAVHFVARKVLRDETLAEDVVQDVFVAFWNSPGGVAGGVVSSAGDLVAVITDT